MILKRSWGQGSPGPQGPPHPPLLLNWSTESESEMWGGNTWKCESASCVKIEKRSQDTKTRARSENLPPLTFCRLFRFVRTWRVMDFFANMLMYQFLMCCPEGPVMLWDVREGSLFGGFYFSGWECSNLLQWTEAGVKSWCGWALSDSSLWLRFQEICVAFWMMEGYLNLQEPRVIWLCELCIQGGKLCPWNSLPPVQAVKYPRARSSCDLFITCPRILVSSFTPL